MRHSDALGAVADVAAAQHGAFSRRQAAEKRVNSRHLKKLIEDGALAEPVKGVIVSRTARRTWHQAMMVATLVPPGFHAGIRAAGYLHDIDGIKPKPKPEILGPRNARTVRGIEVVQHWVGPLDRQDVIKIDSIPCTSLALTVIHLCGLGDPDLALRVVDAFERRGGNLNWLETTARRLDRSGATGPRIALELLDQRQNDGPVPGSWFERLAERCLALPGLPPWERQYPLYYEGRRIARPDLACPILKLGIEGHSRRFHFGLRREAADQRRDVLVALIGWDLLYFRWADVQDPVAVAGIVEKAAWARAEQLRIKLPWVA